MPCVGVEASCAHGVVVIPHQPRALIVGVIILRHSGHSRHAVQEVSPPPIARARAGWREPRKGPPSEVHGSVTAVQVNDHAVLRPVRARRGWCLQAAGFREGNMFFICTMTGRPRSATITGPRYPRLAGRLVHVSPQRGGIGKVRVHLLLELNGGKSIEVGAQERDLARVFATGMPLAPRPGSGEMNFRSNGLCENAHAVPSLPLNKAKLVPASAVVLIKSRRVNMKASGRSRTGMYVCRQRKSGKSPASVRSVTCDCPSITAIKCHGRSA